MAPLKVSGVGRRARQTRDGSFWGCVMNAKRHVRRLPLFVVLAALLLPAAVLLGAGCGSGKKSTPTASSTGAPHGDLTLFAYEDGFIPPYIKGFKDQYPNVNLRTSAYDSGDAAIAKLRAGFRADVINLCVEEDAEMAVRLGLVQPLDISRITNWDRMFPVFYKLPGVTMPDGKHYMVPVDAGVTGILYDTTKVPVAPTSFKDLFDPKYKGQVAMIDYPVTAIQVGALALGYTDPVHLTDEQLNNVKDLYLTAMRNGQFRTFFNNDSEIVSLFHTGEVSIALGYPSNAIDSVNEGDPVKFVTASEGQIVWTCGYGISSTAKNVDAAYALINYYLSPPAEAFEAKRWNYYITNQDALKLLPPDQVKRVEVVKDWKNILPAAPPVEGYDKWIRVWQEVKRG
jgi:spermidine/putrescine transport system substrate-binding protein